MGQQNFGHVKEYVKGLIPFANKISIQRKLARMYGGDEEAEVRAHIQARKLVQGGNPAFANAKIYDEELKQLKDEHPNWSEKRVKYFLHNKMGDKAKHYSAAFSERGVNNMYYLGNLYFCETNDGYYDSFFADVEDLNTVFCQTTDGGLAFTDYAENQIVPVAENPRVKFYDLNSDNAKVIKLAKFAVEAGM